MAFGASGMHDGLLVEIALLATSLGLVVPVLAEAVVLHHPLGVLTGGMRVGGLSHRGRGAFRSESADRPCHWQADCCCSVCWVRSPGGPGCRTYRQLTALADRLADISAQIRIRLTVLLAAGIALGAAGVGFEAILGAFTAGVLVRMLDPSPNWPTPVTDQAGNDQLRPANPGLSRRGRSAPQHSGCR